MKFAGTVLAADTVSVRVSHFIGVRSLGDVRSLGHSAALGAEATHGLASDDQGTSAIPGYLSSPEFPSVYPTEAGALVDSSYIVVVNQCTQHRPTCSTQCKVRRAHYTTKTVLYITEEETTIALQTFRIIIEFSCSMSGGS
jgi:hypothetical protein